jgi:hypothetical protein
VTTYPLLAATEPPIRAVTPSANLGPTTIPSGPDRNVPAAAPSTPNIIAGPYCDTHQQSHAHHIDYIQHQLGYGSILYLANRL